MILSVSLCATHRIPRIIIELSSQDTRSHCNIPDMEHALFPDETKLTYIFIWRQKLSVASIPMKGSKVTAVTASIVCSYILSSYFHSSSA